MLAFEIGIATLTILIPGIASFDQRLSAETARAEAPKRRALPLPGAKSSDIIAVMAADSSISGDPSIKQMGYEPED